MKRTGTAIRSRSFRTTRAGVRHQWHTVGRGRRAGIKTLEFIDSLDAAIVIPGHGDALRDEKLLKATLGVFRELAKRGADAKPRGLDPDAARAEIMPQIKELMVQITGDVRTCPRGMPPASTWLRRFARNKSLP